MEKIIINEEEYLFQVGSIDFENHSEYYTNFYSKTEFDIKKTLKYKWPLNFYWKEEYVPKYIFNVNFDITSPSYTRKYVREKVLKQYENWKGLIARKDEIKQGIYI